MLMTTYFDLDFKNVTVDKLNEFKDLIMTETTRVSDEVASLHFERTFENTVRPMINVETLYHPLHNLFYIVTNFFPQKELRDTSVEIRKMLNEYFVDLSMRQDLYEAFKNYEDNAYQQEKSNLTDEEVRYFEQEMRDYRRLGLHLDEETRNQVKTYKKELADISVEFNKNLNDESTSFEFTREQLDGMPDSWFTEARQVEGRPDTYKCTLDYPDYCPFMDNVKDKELRKKLCAAFVSRCKDENTPLLERAVKVKSVLARMLGYDTHADYKTELSIAKTGQNALDFVNEMVELLTPFYERELESLTEFARSYAPCPLPEKLELYDMRFYQRAYKEESCEFDSQEVRKYFPLDVVKNGMMQIYQTLLELTFTQVETDNVWHEDVDVYDVFDNETSNRIGRFYLDLYPREGKYAHAAVFGLVAGCEYKGERVTTVTPMACNFPKDECLEFDDVVTFFHEFGHVMHNICARVQLFSNRAFCTETDFVEVPSQMFENWCYCEEPLSLMSCHTETGEHLPKELIEKLVRTKTLNQGLHYMRQSVFALYDLVLHTGTFELDSEVDSAQLMADIYQRLAGMEMPEGSNFGASFGHLLGGYDAGYYGYMKSECFSDNIFHVVFKDGNVLNQEVGMKYRKEVLGVGASMDGIDILQSYLGDKMDNKYFLISKGLVDSDNMNVEDV
jgi:thimet oligopeptidase